MFLEPEPVSNTNLNIEFICEDGADLLITHAVGFGVFTSLYNTLTSF